MILTVTLNTAIDKRYTINSLNPKSVMRVNTVENTAGGKGINVSRVASLGGEDVIAMGFVGGYTGDLFESLITQKNIKNSFTKTASDTRYCINVWDESARKSTEFLEPGSSISESELNNFIEDYKRNIKKADIITLCGSLPKNVPTNIYATLVKIAKENNIPVIVDTSGESLFEASKSKPTMLKPNEDEIKQILQIDEIPDRQSLINAAIKLYESGIEYSVISLGKDGMLIACKDGVYHGITPDIPVVNTVGCGDSAVAGFAVGISKKWNIEKTIQYAVAVSTANAMNESTGFYTQSDLDYVMPLIEVKKLK